MRTANRVTGLVVGAVLLVVGVAGLAASLPSGFMGPSVPLFGVLSTNPLLGVLQTLLGIAVGAAAITGQSASTRTNGIVGVLLLALGLAGLFLVGADFNPIAATSTVNALHFGASALLLLVALGADRGTVRPDSSGAPSA